MRLTLGEPVVGAAAVLAFLDGRELPARTPFQTAAWWRAWIRHAATSEGATPVLISAPLPSGGTVLAGLQLHREDDRRVLRPLSWPWADYHDAVAGADADAPSALAGALHAVRGRFDAVLDLPDLVTDGTLHAAALSLGARSRPSSTVVRLDLTSAETVRWMADRGEIRRKRRLLERAGRLSLRRSVVAGELTRRLPAFVALHARQWSQREDVVAPFDGGPVDRTFEAVAADPAGSVRLYELLLEDAVLAGYYGFVLGGTFWAYRTAFDTAYRKLSPGHQLVAAMVTDLAAEGVRTFDLMRGAYAYKLAYPSVPERNAHAELGPA